MVFLGVKSQTTIRKHQTDGKIRVYEPSIIAKDTK